MDREQAEKVADAIQRMFVTWPHADPRSFIDARSELMRALTTTPSAPAPATEACQHAGTCCGEAVKHLRRLVGLIGKLPTKAGGDELNNAWGIADDFLTTLDSKGPTPC